MEIAVSDLRFNYGRKAVLTDVNGTFPSGSITAVLGMNGAGKTTLLKLLSRLIKPRGGCILIDGNPLDGLKRRENARITGYVSQMHGTAKLRVMEYLLIGRTPYRKFRYTQKDEDVVLRVMQSMGLSAFADRWLEELSGGELQQVVIARALVQQPKILLLDEPTNNLDLKNQLEIMNVLKKCSYHLKMTIVFSIHDINLALRYADRFMLIDKGTVVSAGDRKSLSRQLLSQAYKTPLTIHEVNGHTLVFPKMNEKEDRESEMAFLP